MTVMSKKEELGKELAKKENEWKYLLEKGGSDPFHEDGWLMNNIREYIVSLKKRCEKEFPEGDYPPEYYIETPPVTKNSYVARASEIRKKAKKTLALYHQDPNYLWLREQLDNLDDKQIAETGIQRVVNYPEALEFFIKRGDLLGMRMHEDSDKRLRSFERCRKKVEALPRGNGREKNERKVPDVKRVHKKAEAHNNNVRLTVSHKESHKRPAFSPADGAKASKKDKKKLESAVAAKPVTTTKRRKRNTVTDGQLSMFEMGII